MNGLVARIARSNSALFVLVALLAYALASPVQALAESGVEGGLVAVEQRVIAAEAAIQSLQTRMSAAETAIGNLQSGVVAALTQAKQYADQVVGNEATARAAADATLQSNIDSEATARTAADATLQGNIGAEATARANGDASTLAAAKAYTDSKGVGSLSLITVDGPLVTLCSLLDPSEGCVSAAPANATCPAGRVATGGGFLKSPQVDISISRPASSTTWTVFAQNTSPINGAHVHATVVCARVVP